MKSLYRIYLLLLLTSLLAQQAIAQKNLIATYSETLLNGKFTPYDSVIYSYNGGNIKQSHSKYYDSKTNEWINYILTDYTYNANNNLSFQELKYWVADNWKPFYNYSYTYENGKLKTENELRWKDNKWINYTKREDYYSTLNQADSTIRFKYDTLNNLSNYTKSTFKYNADENIDEQVDFWWSGAWYNTTRYVYTYNAQKQNTSYNIYTFSQQWDLKSTVYLTYDNEGDIVSWEQKDANGTTTNKGVYIYDKNSLGIEAKETLSAAVFPNPAAESATFSFEKPAFYTLQIADFTGHYINSYTCNGSNYTLNTSSLKQGIYYYTITNEKGNTTNGKLLVR